MSRAELVPEAMTSSGLWKAAERALAELDPYWAAPGPHPHRAKAAAWSRLQQVLHEIRRREAAGTLWH